MCFFFKIGHECTYLVGVVSVLSPDDLQFGNGHVSDERMLFDGVYELFFYFLYEDVLSAYASADGDLFKIQQPEEVYYLDGDIPGEFIE